MSKFVAKEPGKFRLDGVRIAFPVLNDPEQFQGQGKPRYSATLIIPGDDKAVYEQLKAQALVVMTAAVGAAKAKAQLTVLEANLKVPYGDGAKKANYDGFDGNFFLACHTQTAPTLLDNSVDPATGKAAILDRPQNRIYAGSHVNAMVSLYWQAKWGRLCASVSGVQFSHDGDAFSGAVAASEDEFEAVDAAGADDLA